jgi:DNA-binding Lrp family transcriptional regulator
MEDAGVIKGYRAQLSAPDIALNFSSLVFVTLREGHQKAVADFEDALPRVPYIIQAQRLFGDPDYLLMVVTADLPAFQKLYDEELSRLPNVQRLTSTLVMKHVITDRPLPLE